MFKGCQDPIHAIHGWTGPVEHGVAAWPCECQNVPKCCMASAKMLFIMNQYEILPSQPGFRGCLLHRKKRLWGSNENRVSGGWTIQIWKSFPRSWRSVPIFPEKLFTFPGEHHAFSWWTWWTPPFSMNFRVVIPCDAPPGWWFGTWLLFSHSVGNVIIPTDFHSIIFQRGQRGWLKPPTRLSLIILTIYE